MIMKDLHDLYIMIAQIQKWLKPGGKYAEACLLDD